MKDRMKAVLTPEMLETTQNKKNLNPMANTTSSQRQDLLASQFNNMVTPLTGDTPNFDSCMSQEYLTHSSCIQQLHGTVTVHAKISYQHRTVYVYDVDGMYDVFDTTGVITHGGFSQPLITDLMQCEIGVPYKITKKEPMYLQYPGGYNPATRTVQWGHNVRTVISTNKDNAQDSVAVSQSFVRKFACIKSRVVNINLKQKILLSEYEDIFPPIGKVIHGPVLLKICQDEGIITKQIQTGSVPSGFEDEIIVVEDNSYIGMIEVFSNVEIKDPKLEKYRKELLAFREKIYNTLQPIIKQNRANCSVTMKALAEHCKYTLFRSDDMELIHPYIRITLHQISFSEEGTKHSNLAGGKVTIQEIYPDGSLCDEYGRNIEMEYPSTAIVNRSVGSMLYELHFTAIAEQLHWVVRNNLISKETMYTFLQKFYSILGKDTHREKPQRPNGCMEEFEYLNWDADTWWEYLQDHDWKIVLYPFSSGVDLETETHTLKLAEEMIGFRKLKLFRKETTDMQILGRPSSTNHEEVIPLTDLHAVGTMFIFRDMHDPAFGNSSTSAILRDVKGFPLENNSSRRDGRSFYKKKSAKKDVNTRYLEVNMATNADAAIMMNDKTQGLYQIKETMEAGGISLTWEDTIGGNDGEDGSCTGS